jgi:hypothetical protein
VYQTRIRSYAINVRIVWGPSLEKEGIHPYKDKSINIKTKWKRERESRNTLKNAVGPSLFSIFMNASPVPLYTPFSPVMIRVFKTSKGEQTYSTQFLEYNKSI